MAHKRMPTGPTLDDREAELLRGLHALGFHGDRRVTVPPSDRRLPWLFEVAGAVAAYGAMLGASRSEVLAAARRHWKQEPISAKETRHG